MGNLCHPIAMLLLSFFIFHPCFQIAGGYNSSSTTQDNREALEVLDDHHNGDWQSKPPPPPPKHKQCTPPQLRQAIKTIRRFNTRITSDPKGITKTWRGNNICTDTSTYKGFLCGKIPGDNSFRIAGVKFNGFNLNGNPLSLTDFIEGFEDLVFFHANSNNFSSSIPFNIASLPYFYELDLSNNRLTGTFPTQVLSATNLTFLDLRFNQLSGTLPPRVFIMDLDVLFLNNNRFTGKIPNTLGFTPALYLTLANNQLSGPIPDTIGRACNTLLEVLFLNNNLSGCLPYQIGLLKRTTIFDASKNRLTGLIPNSFGCLGKMEQLDLSENQLFGPVPELVCKLKNLHRLSLKKNYFTQVGPECRKLIARKVMDVSMNCILDLPWQRSAAECAAFFSEHRSCGDQRWLTHVPCHIDHSKSSSAVVKPSNAPSRSYAALIQHP